MFASAHLGAGLVAGMAASRASGGVPRRVLIGLALGLASHVMLDAVPHADYGFIPRRYILPIAVGETAVVLTVAWLILRRRLTQAWGLFLAAGLFGAAIPDMRFGLGFLPPMIKFKILFFTYWTHSFFHAEPVVFWIGMTTQVMAVVACMATLFAFPIVERDAPPSAWGYLPRDESRLPPKESGAEKAQL